MSTKEIFGFLNIFPEKSDKKATDPVQTEVQAGNVSFRQIQRDRTILYWDTASSGAQPSMRTQPWKMASLMVDDDPNVGHTFLGGQTAGGPAYPIGGGGLVTIATLDYPHFRNTGAWSTAVTSADMPRVIGSVCAAATEDEAWLRTDGIVSINDIPKEYTQIGIVYPHPMLATSALATVAVAGAVPSYITLTDLGHLDSPQMDAHVFNLVRLGGVVDAGLYILRNHDTLGNKLYLMTLDGLVPNFTAGSTPTVYTGPGRRAYFNEVGVIQLSTGTVKTGGTFRPGAARNSFILRVVFDKTGSDETVSGAEAQSQGSYFLTCKPYTHGEGLGSLGLLASGRDTGEMYSNVLQASGGTALHHVNFFDGGCNGQALDEVNQRLWFGYTNNSSQSGIGYWRWKTAENIREVANYLGTAYHATFVTPSIALGAGEIIRDLRIGPARNVYISIHHASGANGGIVVIPPTALPLDPVINVLQYNVLSGGGAAIPASTVAGTGLDWSRARVGTALDASTDGANKITSPSGKFTSADKFRAIKLTGAGADNGTYKIITISSATEVLVQTLAGGAVTFTSQTNKTFEIGERLYVFFRDATTGLGKINYMESLAHGTFLSHTVPAWVATDYGATCMANTGGAEGAFGDPSKVAVDQATGSVYWLSSDTQQQVNKYDPTTDVQSRITVANVQSPSGGVGTIGTITRFTSIAVNPLFDAIWVGTDQGQVKIVKSTFATGTVKRYFGGDTANYANPTGFYRPGGFGVDLSTRVSALTPYPDGKMSAWICDPANGLAHEATYARESDLWQSRLNATNLFYMGGAMPYTPSLLFDSIGNFTWICPVVRFWGNGGCTFGFGSMELQYQYDAGNATWIPLEVAQTGLPNPGAREVHTDGAVSLGTATFTTTASGFVVGDEGKYLRIHTGATANRGIYRISLYNSATSVDLVKLNGAAFNSTATASGLSYDFLPALSALTKPLHSGLEDALYGVKLQFEKVAGAANNQFLGRIGQDRLMQTDGATINAASAVSQTFNGTGFALGDVGKLLRIETSSVAGDIGIYQISAFTSGTTISLKKLDKSSFAYGPSAGALNYSVWDLQNLGTNAGPETATVLLADGFGKDNTQDISGLSYETFQFKTLLQENVEPIKYCVSNPLGVPGSQEMKVYHDTFTFSQGAVLGSQSVATTQARALPGAEHSAGGFNGRKLVDGVVGGLMDNAGTNRGMMDSSPANVTVWYGTLASDGFGFLTAATVGGCCPMVDLGADAEVGFVILRGRQKSGSVNNYGFTAVSHGMKATLYKASGTVAPVAAATARTTGTTNITLVLGNNTITLTSGDFLGPVSQASLSNGSVTALGNTFTGTFLQIHVGMVLKITSVGEVGSYRITAVNPGNTIATIQNLNQTAKAWAGSVSSIVYEVRDGVREEDVICTNAVAASAIASPVQRLCVERLLTTTTAQVRVAPFAAITSTSWAAAIPTWDKVKRVSHNTEAVPPDVKNNGTWLSIDGREQYDGGDFKIYLDLTDLSVAQRTGRWWQMQMMPRGANATSGDFWLGNFEFYSPTGARLGISPYTFADNITTYAADFLSHYVNRADFIQSRYDATGIANYNGLVGLGGANGDTLTLAVPTDKFLGYQVRRPYADGVSITGAGGNFTSATAVFLTSDAGRTLRITGGTGGGDVGHYRISTVTNPTTIVVIPVSGVGSTTFVGDTAVTFTIHEGISVTGTAPDRIVFLDDPSRDYTIATINDAMTIITIVEARQTPVTGKQWEIRRPAFDSTSGAVDSTKLARLLRPGTSYPLQPGDITHDSRGALRFWTDDIGNGNQRTDGSITGGDKTFTGTGFCQDDVGRLLYIVNSATAANNGIYKITVVNVGGTIATVDSAYPGGSIANFTADAGATKTYKIFGDRRFKLTKQVTTLRS